MSRSAARALVLAFLAAASRLPAQTITTIAGNGLYGPAKEGVAASASPFAFAEGIPGGLALDAEGSLYVSETSAERVWKIDGKTGLLVAVAGSGQGGFSGDGGPATAARLHEPGDLAFDREGNLYVADLGNNRVRRVDRKSGAISTFAGTGRPLFTKDGLPATETPLGRATGLVFDPAGNLFLIESYSGRLLRIDAKTGLVSTVAGNDTTNFDPGATSARGTGLPVPSSARRTSRGEIVLSVTGANALVKVNPATGELARIAGTGIPGYAGDGGPATKAQLSQPTAVAVDRDDNVFFVDWENNVVRRVDAKTGLIETRVGSSRMDRYGEMQTAGFSGDGGPATKARLWRPDALAFDGDGNLFVIDARNHRIRRVEKAGR
jgi:sugar lactone lactonase YvrE